MSIPGIPVDPRGVVYRVFVEQFETDPILGGRVNWDFSLGTKNRKPIVNNRPSIYMFPQFAANERMAVDAWRSDLAVEIRIYLPGVFDALDLLDVWGALERVVYPQGARDKQFAFEDRLRDAGAEHGEVNISQPARIVVSNNAGSPTVEYAVGEMSIACIRPINS